MEIEIDIKTANLLRKELLARKSNSCTILSHHEMVPKLGPKKAKRAPSPMNLVKKRQPKEINLEPESIFINNSDDEVDIDLKDFKIEECDRPSEKRRTTIKLSTGHQDQANDLLNFKITLSNENLFHMKNNNSIINFMKNSSDKNVRSLYEEINSAN